MINLFINNQENEDRDDDLETIVEDYFEWEIPDFDNLIFHGSKIESKTCPIRLSCGQHWLVKNIDMLYIY